MASPLEEAVEHLETSVANLTVVANPAFVGIWEGFKQLIATPQMIAFRIWTQDTKPNPMPPKDSEEYRIWKSQEASSFQMIYGTTPTYDSNGDLIYNNKKVGGHPEIYDPSKGMNLKSQFGRLVDSMLARAKQALMALWTQVKQLVEVVKSAGTAVAMATLAVAQAAATLPPSPSVAASAITGLVSTFNTFIGIPSMLLSVVPGLSDLSVVMEIGATADAFLTTVAGIIDAVATAVDTVQDVITIVSTLAALIP